MSLKRPSRGPTSIGALLRTSPVGRATVVDQELWQRAVGERVADRTETGRLREGTLTVRVASSVWAQELSLLAPTIARRLRELGAAVQHLRFQVGAVNEHPASTARRTCAPRPIALPPDLRERLAQIEDASLRTAIAEAAAYGMARSRETTTSSKRAPRAPGCASPRTARSDRT